ncbi:MAG: RNA polymerase sigma factor [Candidatus Paceibacterota bacterium]|jgi:RNA polymerase sigma-70 factor (ECF subfamily)
MSKFDSLSDEELAESTKKGDDEAYRTLMLRHMRHIFNFARQYTKSEEDTEDVVQDSFFKAWKYIKLFEKGKNFRPWLFTITRNTALDHIKKKRAMSFSELDDGNEDMSFADTLHDPEPLPQEIFEKGQLAEEMEAAMTNLHPDHRAVLIMHYREEMTFDEIAVVMKKPMNTVKSWHRRALIKIRSLFVHQRPN